MIKTWAENPVSRALLKELKEKRDEASNHLLSTAPGQDRIREILISVINTLNSIIDIEDFLSDVEE